MDPVKALEITCDLFLTSGILLEGVCENIKEQIKMGQYEKVAKFFIYRLILEMNESPIYNEIRRDSIASCIFMLVSIDLNGFKDSLIIEQFANLIYKVIKYSLENKLDLITNKEKSELIKVKLKELANTIYE